jgi:hypothetical protein
MILDRISLVNAYKALKYVNDNDGKVTEMLFNRKSYYGTKTYQRFKDLAALKAFIGAEFGYQHFDPACDCGTGIENIWNLLSFNVYLKDLTTQTESKYAIFVNNMRQDFESGKKPYLNAMSVKKIQEVFNGNLRLIFLGDNYECESYIQQQGDYVNPCDYIEIVSNDFYRELINDYYYHTRNYDI